MVVLKVKCGSDIRRFGRLEPLTYERVLQLVGDSWPHTVAVGTCLKYRDDAGQYCMLTAQTMQDALSEVKGTARCALLKLYLHPGPLPAMPLAPTLMASTVPESAPPMVQGVPALVMEPASLGSAGTRMTPAPPESMYTMAAEDAQQASQATPGCDLDIQEERFPARMTQRRVLMQKHRAVDATLHWSVWSVWPGISREGAVASFGATVSPWAQGANLEIHLPGECEVVDLRNAGLTRLTEDGLLMLKLAHDDEVYDFSGVFCFPNLEVRTVYEKLLEALQDPKMATREESHPVHS